MKSTTLKLTLLILTLSGYLASGAMAGDETGNGQADPSAQELLLQKDENYGVRNSSGGGNGVVTGGGE